MDNHNNVSMGMALLLAFLCFLLGAAGMYIYMNSKTTATTTASPTPMVTASASPTATATISAIPTPTATVSISDWKSYVSSNDKYSVKYPKTWIYDSNSTPGTVTFKPTADDQWAFAVKTATTNKTLQQNVDDLKAAKTNQGCMVKSADTTVNSQTATKIYSVCEGGYGDTDVLVINNGKLYTISQGVGTNPTTSTMLSTFQFAK